MGKFWTLFLLLFAQPLISIERVCALF